MSTLSISKPETIQIGKYLADSFSRDKSDFVGFSPRYVDPFITNFLASLDEVAALPSSKTRSGELKAVTKRILDNLSDFHVEMNRLESWISLATLPLTIAKNDFGIKAVRKSINKAKVADFSAAMNGLLINVRANLDQLTDAGMASNFIEDFELEAKNLSDDKVLQHNIKSNRKELTQYNSAQYDQLHNMMKLIMESGKTIYTRSNPVRVKDYTLTDLKRRHNADKKSVLEAVPA